jgi:translation initiation factor 2 alpha subunit (eIF-2alpha)
MDFNDSLKYMDTSSKKVKQNRQKREQQKFEKTNKTVNELFKIIDEQIEAKKAPIKPYKIEYFANVPFYTIYYPIVNHNKKK